MWLGLCAVLVPPSPKSQLHEAMEPVEVSLKVTVRGAGPEVTSALKAATGAGTTVTVTVAVTVPPEPVAVSVYAVVAAGLTLMLPSADSPLPTPLSIATLVAFVVVHVKVEAFPAPMVAGVALKLSTTGAG